MNQRTSVPGNELLYVSWGGNGRTVALRTAFEAALERSKSLLYLAVLDADHFGDLDKRFLSLVVDELEWLLDAQLRLVASQLNAEGHPARILVRVGDVYNELSDVVKASTVDLVLVPAEVAESAAQITRITGVPVETV